MRNKRGQPAIIIKANNPENLGKIVICQEYLGYFEQNEQIYRDMPFAAQITDHYWKIISESDSLVVGVGGGQEVAPWAISPDTWLMPIPPMDSDDFIDEVLEETKSSLLENII